MSSRWALQLDGTGKPFATLQINTDIGERKQAVEELRKSKERWRAVFENSAAGIALADSSGRFQAANPAYQEMLGYSPDELRKLSLLDEDDRERSWILCAGLISGQQVSAYTESVTTGGTAR